MTLPPAVRLGIVAIIYVGLTTGGFYAGYQFRKNQEAKSALAVLKDDAKARIKINERKDEKFKEHRKFADKTRNSKRVDCFRDRLPSDINARLHSKINREGYGTIDRLRNSITPR